MRILNHTGVPLILIHTNDVIMDGRGTLILRDGTIRNPTLVFPPESGGHLKPPKMVIREVLDVDTGEISVFRVSFNQNQAQRPEFYRLDNTYWVVSREQGVALKAKGEYTLDILTPGRPVHKQDGTIVGYADLATI